VIVNETLLENTDIWGLERVCKETTSFYVIDYYLIHNYEKQAGDYTALEDAKSVSERIGRPVWRKNEGNEAFIVMERSFGEPVRHMIPVEGKLDEVVFERTIGISNVGEQNRNLTFAELSIFECFEEEPAMFETPGNSREGSFLDCLIYVIVVNEERTQHAVHAGPEHFSARRRAGNVAQEFCVSGRLTIFDKEDHESMTPAQGSTLLFVCSHTLHVEFLSHTRK
jgi:hypothetical protein